MLREMEIKMKSKIYDFCKNNIIYIISILFLTVCFYILIVNTGVSTHDELYNFLDVQMRGKDFLNISLNRWGNSVIHRLPSYLQFLSNSMWTYRIFTLIGLLIPIAATFRLIYKYFDKKIAWIFPLCFFMFAQLNLEHNGFISFSWTYQVDIVFIIVSLELYCSFFEHGRKLKTLILSAIFYLLASMSYEEFILFGALHFLIAILYLNKEKELSIKNLFKYLWFHALLAILYTLSWFVLDRYSNIVNGDAAIDSPYGLYGFIITIIKLIIGLFPLRYKAYSWKQLILKSIEITSENILNWAILLVITLVIVSIIPKVKKITIKSLIFMNVFCMVGMFVSVALLGITKKFVSWIAYEGVGSFGISYYAYYFIIFLLILWAVYLYQICPIKKIVLIGLFGIIVFTGKFTYISNSTIAAQMRYTQDRYDIFGKLINSDYFKQIEENSIIYAPDYMGVHIDFKNNSNYVRHLTGLNVTFTNDIKSIDYSKTVYYLNYDTTMKLILFGAVDKDNITDEVFIVTLDNSFINYNFSGKRETLEDKVTELKVNEKNIGLFSSFISTPLYNQDNNIVINAKDMIFNTLSIQSGSQKNDSSIIQLKGIYNEEVIGRWAMKDSEIEIDNINRKKECEIEMSISTANGENAQFRIKYADLEEIYSIGAEPTLITLKIPLTKKKNVIKFQSNASSLEVQGDKRDLNIRFSSLNINYGKFKQLLINY